MKGIVKYINKKMNRVAVLTELGYTVFDIHQGEVNMNDEITGNLDDHGSHNLVDQTTGHTLRVYIEAIQADLQFVRSLLDH
jgi:hypothetical protein